LVPTQPELSRTSQSANIEVDQTKGPSPIVLVIIATLHNVKQVSNIINTVPKSSDLYRLRWLVVDNGPIASLVGWPEEAEIIVDNQPIGSAAFLKGLITLKNDPWDWVLFLDDDAAFRTDFFDELVSELGRWTHCQTVNTQQPIAFSCSTNKIGDGWAKLNRFTFLGVRRRLAKASTRSPIIPIHLAPWNGLIFNRLGIDLVPTSKLIDMMVYFFSWDDYALCAEFQRRGGTLYGLRHPVIGNPRKNLSTAGPWRAFYNARNSLIFASDVGYARPIVVVWLLLDYLATRLRNHGSKDSAVLKKMNYLGLKAGLRGDHNWGILPPLPSKEPCPTCSGSMVYESWSSKLGPRHAIYNIILCHKCGCRVSHRAEPGNPELHGSGDQPKPGYIGESPCSGGDC